MRALAVTALIAGVLLRIATLSISVPAVDNPWRAWSYHAATRGPWNMYGPKGSTVRFAAIDEPVVYPPLALDALAVIGRAHLSLNHGRFDDDVALTRTIKASIALVDGVLAALLFVTVRHVAGSVRAWWSALAYWMNPAVLLTTTLGFLDVFVALPAVGAVIAASSGRVWLSGALFAGAVLIKPQGLLVGPAVAVALWNAGARDAGVRRLGRAAGAAALTVAVVAAPVVIAGHTLHMIRSVAVLAGHNMLSALAFNAWWIVSYLFAAAAAAGGGIGAALAASPEVVTHATAMASGWPHPRFIAGLLLVSGIGWAVWVARNARDVGTQAALAAFIVCAYFTLSVQVHENHFFLALPLLVVAAALRPVFAPVLAAISASSALNLYLIYGVRGDGPPEWATRIAGIDATVLVAIAACALFGWFAIVFGRSVSERAA